MQTVYRHEAPPSPPDNPRSIPASIEAERAVLGSLMMDPEAIIKVSGFLRPTDFFRERHTRLYDAMFALSERREPIDFVTLVEELERRGQLGEIGGAAYLTDLIASTPSALYAEYYAHIVEEAAARRRMIAAAGKVAELAYSETVALEEAIDQAEQAIFAIAERRSLREMTPARTLMGQVVERIEAAGRNPDRLSGLETGLTMFDRFLGGFQKSDLIILAARPAMGKTSFALTIARNAANDRKRVAFFSLEMSKEQLGQRLLSMETAIDSHRLRQGKVHEDEWAIVMEAANRLADATLFIDDTPAVNVAHVRAAARRLYAEQGLDLIVVDYLQLMTSGQADNRHQELSRITKGLKALARELDIPVIVLSQLNRGVESRADKRPQLGDLRESGAIEEDADVVLFIYRDDYYHEDSDRQNIADIIVAKHRHGASGTVSLFFRKELTQFRDLEIQRTDFEY